ncbi:hypothetical protein NW761_005560 [Fusarium oxysporum]|nr:hypothetical protein NW758_004966 [Fusarium oxysporum]KAJ4095098.1 hypothetical protein NW761_005560 [Fusarium oxysporum]KAJ4114038.1 hypothetical protein NW769_004818 [Fusarium oxysporum]KAJ4240647.1 hypothetical protein NW760_000929 [Fusarium oxysporum]
MKCRPMGQDTSKCERCTRKALDCIFREHRRGRKPGTKVTKTKKVPTISPQSIPSLESPAAAGAHISETEDDTNNLQPSGLLNHQALEGKFSLGNILSADQEPVQRQRSRNESLEDPIELGLITPSLAKSLFDSFITVLNPYISQLDPYLHTFTYVRSKSAFLLSSILAMSAKAFNHVLYAKLYDHSQDLFANVFRRGSKSIEIVQAILILTYWKEAQDTRVWTSVGYAIRICMDLGWHKLAHCGSAATTTETESQKRERRNIERTWYVLFVYDRSISLQTGRPWMIECSEFIELIEDWCNDPSAIDNDQLLGAFTTLRLVTSAAFPLLIDKSRQRSMSHNESAPLVRLLDGRIERWEKKWTEKITAQTEQSCHEFLIRFYGTHLRLQLHTLPLHGILISGKSDINHHIDTVWVAYSSALNMLQVISRFSEHICYAQDSIHVMTAYSAAFLVKITLVFSDFITGQLESTCIEAIQHAAEVFSSQSGCISSSCTLQATFLAKVALKLVENQGRRKVCEGGESTAIIGPSPQIIDQDDMTGGLGADSEGSSSSQRPPDLGSLDISFLAQESLDFPFDCDDMWAEMFGMAGMNPQDVSYFSQTDC